MPNREPHRRSVLQTPRKFFYPAENRVDYGPDDPKKDGCALSSRITSSAALTSSAPPIAERHKESK